MTSPTKSIEVKLELGHRAVLRSKPTAEGFTHDWTVFVRGPEACNIQHFVDKVVFLLHESFPKPKRVLKEPPYQVSESGYAGFNMPIEVYFRTKEDPKKVEFVYDLYLSLDGTPISNIRCEKLTFHNPPDDFCHKLLKAGGTESNRSGSSTSPAPPPNTLGSPKVKERPRSEGHKKPRLSTDMGKSPSVEAPPPPPPLPTPPPRLPTQSQPFTDLFGTPIKRDQLVEKSSKSKDSKSSSLKSKSSKSHKSSSSSVALPKPPSSSSSASKEHKSSSKDKERHKDSSKERSREKEKVREPRPPPVETSESKPAETEKKAEKGEKHKDKTKERSKSKSKEKSSRDQSSKSSAESKSRESSSKHGTSSRRPPSPPPATPSDPPPKKPRPPSPPAPPPEKEKKKKESKSSHRPKESPKKPPPPLIPPLSDPTPERQLSEGDMDLSFTPSPKAAFFPSSPPPSRDDSLSPTPPAPPPSLLNCNPPTKVEPLSPKPTSRPRGPASPPDPPPPSSPGSASTRGPLNALMMEMEQEDLLSPLSSPSASPTRRHSTESHPDDTVPVQPVDHLKELKELKSRILNLKDPHRLQAVVDLVEETGLYKMTSATFDFDLCALDPLTLDKLQDCLNGR